MNCEICGYGRMIENEKRELLVCDVCGNKRRLR